jgi:hypothetical protein
MPPTTNNTTTTSQTIEAIEPEIIKTEDENVLRKAPRNKAPRIDNVPTELLVAVGETGIAWLLKIFSAAWQQQAVPDDWK